MKINVDDWKEFKLSELFECSTTKAIDVSVSDVGNIPYITRSTGNNGCSGFFNESDKYINKGNCITIGAEGAVAYYQDKDFLTGVKVYTLRNSKLNELNSMFIITILNMKSPLYSYGRARILDKIKNEIIKLPHKDGQPDFIYMEKYIKSLNSKRISTNIQKKDLTLDFANFNEYRLSDLFIFSKGKRLTKSDMIDGNQNYIGAISENNGVRQLIDIDEFDLEEGNCITVNYNGSVGEAFYQKEKFWASDDVNILRLMMGKLNIYIAMFIITLIKSNRYKFSYGRKWTLDKMQESIIKLPSNPDGSPDFLFMEEYIKSLPYSDKIE